MNNKYTNTYYLNEISLDSVKNGIGWIKNKFKQKISEFDLFKCIIIYTVVNKCNKESLDQIKEKTKLSDESFNNLINSAKNIVENNNKFNELKKEIDNLKIDTNNKSINEIKFGNIFDKNNYLPIQESSYENIKNVIIQNAYFIYFIAFIINLEPVKYFIFNKIFKIFNFRKSTVDLICNLIGSLGSVIPILVCPFSIMSIFGGGLLLIFRLKGIYNFFKMERNYETIKDENTELKSNTNYIYTIPFFNFNMNSRKIFYTSNCIKLSYNYESAFNEYIQNLKSIENNQSFIDILKNGPNISIYNLNMNNNKIIGFYNKSTSKTINFIINDEILNNWKSIYKTFNMEKFIKCLIISLKPTYELYGVKKEILTINGKIINDCRNEFINLINIRADSNKFFKQYTKSISGNEQDVHIINNSIFNEKACISLYDPDNQSNYPMNISNLSQLVIEKQSIYSDGKIIEIYINQNNNIKNNINQNNNIKNIINQNDNNDNNNQLKKQNSDKVNIPQLSIPKSRIIDNINDIKIGDIVSGASIGALVGEISSQALTQYIAEFCNLYPTAGSIIKPLLQNPKSSGAIIGTLLGMKMGPLARKLINFIKKGN